VIAHSSARAPTRAQLTKLDLAIIGAALIGPRSAFLWYAFPAESWATHRLDGLVAHSPRCDWVTKTEFLLLLIGASCDRGGVRSSRSSDLDGAFLLAPIHHHFR
jgi:hypothetical protein